MNQEPIREEYPLFAGQKKELPHIFGDDINKVVEVEIGGK